MSRAVYAETGRSSIDLVIFFKHQLILFFEGMRSEHQLLRVVADRLSLRWYLGYDLTESLLDHSSLTRGRELDVFRSAFETIVAPCVKVGLIWGEERSLDATKVEANAALVLLRTRFAVEAQLAHLVATADDEGNDRTGAPAKAADDAPVQMPLALTPQARSALAERAAQRHDWIGSAGRPNCTEPSGAYRRTADFRISATDSDATPLPRRDGQPHVGYVKNWYKTAPGSAFRNQRAATLAPPPAADRGRTNVERLRALPLPLKDRPGLVSGTRCELGDGGIQHKTDANPERWCRVAA